MGIYVITGGSSGIGAKTVEILKEKGHQVVNIDLKGGDIDANLATKEGRKKALDALHRQFPDGIDAMIYNGVLVYATNPNGKETLIAQNVIFLHAEGFAIHVWPPNGPVKVCVSNIATDTNYATPSNAELDWSC